MLAEPVVSSLVLVAYVQLRSIPAMTRLTGIGAKAMAEEPAGDTGAEHRHRLWWGISRRGPVQWISICIVLAMVAALFWLAIHFSKPAAF